MSSEDIVQNYHEDAAKALRAYKKLAEKAIAQLQDEEFFVTLDEESNSVAVVMKHMAGNMLSRWTDFLTSDGEKPDRNRDLEFVIEPHTTKDDVIAYWDRGWKCVFDALAPGQFYQGYDRKATGALNITASQQFANVLGAQQGVVGVDLAVRSVYNLPNPNVRRYGRPDTFGPAPINGFCPPAAPEVTYIGCTLAGFVTPSAVGARFRAQLTYQIPQIPALVLVTTLIYGRDFYGWSYDGSINEGRNIALARLTSSPRMTRRRSTSCHVSQST